MLQLLIDNFFAVLFTVYSLFKMMFWKAYFGIKTTFTVIRDLGPMGPEILSVIFSIIIGTITFIKDFIYLMIAGWESFYHFLQ